MIYLIAGLLTIQTLLLMFIAGALVRQNDLQKASWEEIRNLRLVSRTRVKKASVQSGVADPEVQLSRLGRTTKSRRVVVGGDGDSDLNKVLSGFVSKGGTNE